MLFPFLGLVISLTLWGTFFPVPGTNVNPHESLVGRLTGAIKASFIATGTYELVMTVSSRVVESSWHQDIDNSGDRTDLVAIPDSTWTASMPVIKLATETAESSLVVSDSMGADSVEPSVKASRCLATLVAGALVFAMGCWLGLVLFNANKLKDWLVSFGRLFEPTPKVAHHLVADVTATVNSRSVVVLETASSTYESVVAVVESSCGLGRSGVIPIYSNWEGVPYTGFVSARTTPTSIPVVSPLQLWKGHVVPDSVTFHPAVDVAISRLVRLRIDLVVSEPDCITTGSDTIPAGAVSPRISCPAASEAPGRGSVCLHQTKALVLCRLENISHLLVLQLVLVLVACWEDGQTAVTGHVRPEEVATPRAPKKNRAGQRTRRRLARRELREKQAEVVKEIEEQSGGTVSPTQQTPPSPAPSSPAKPFVPATTTSLVPSRRAAPVYHQVSGHGHGHPPPPLPPPRQHMSPHTPPFVPGRGPSGQFQPLPPAPAPYGPAFAGQPPYRQAPGQGGQVPPFPWQYQQYGPPNSSYRRF